MKKIKITLTNGSTIEKPVLTAFKGTYGDYVVLDNESVGSMGLPVILISKVQDNKLSTIVDANEWNTIKDNLRNIIAGNQIVKITIGDQYIGDDVYYKQLTLPVASFDALKNTYGEADSTTSSAQPTPAPTPTAAVAPTIETPAPTPTVESVPTPNVNPAPVMPTNVNPESVAPSQVVQQPVSPMPNVSSVGPIAPEATPAPSPTMPNASVAPSPTPATTEMPMPPMNEMATTPVAPTPEPVVEPIPAGENKAAAIDVAADKEAFLKACENMFDALVAKFNK